MVRQGEGEEVGVRGGEDVGDESWWPGSQLFAS